MSRRRCLLRYSVLFLVVFALGFAGFFMCGKSFVWKSDGYRQYYPALDYLGRYYRSIVSGVFHGTFDIPMVDYTIGQGEDIITTLANYGLGDPLTLLAAFVPGSCTEYLYGFLVMLRLYLSGASFLLYCEGMGWKRENSVFGALVYAFCGFAIWSVKDPFFLNALIYFPLILFGIERVRRGKGSLPLVFSVFLCVMSGYYFFYMAVLGALSYFVCRNVRFAGIRAVLREGVRCLAAGLCGVLLSGALTVPILYGYAQSSRGSARASLSSLFAYDFTYYKNMFVRFFTVADSDDAGAVAYFSIAVVIFPALYVLFRAGDKVLSRVRYGVVLTALAVASPLVGYAMNGFGYVTNRFMFIPAFLLSAVLVRTLPDIFAMGEGERRCLITAAVVYAAVCLFLSRDGGLPAAVFMVVMLGALLAVLFGIRNERWRRQAVLGLVVCNLVGNVNLLYLPIGAGMLEAYMDAGSVRRAYVSDRSVNRAKKILSSSDDGLGRIDVMLHGGENPNQSMVADYPGVSVYYSVINSGYSDYMLSLENAPDLMYSHRVLGNDGRTILENLANVAFVVSRERALVPYGFVPVDGKKNVYANQCRTSVGYFYDSYVSESEFDVADVFDRQETLLSSAVLEPDSALCARASASEEVEKGEVRGEWDSLAFDMTAFEQFKWEGKRVEITGKNGGFSLSFVMKPDREYYLRFTGLAIEEAGEDTAWAHVRIGDVKKSFLISSESYDFHLGRSKYAVNLGSLPMGGEAGEREVRVRINGPAKYAMDNIELIEVPMDGVAEKMEKLCEGGLRDVTVEKDGSVTATAPGSERGKLLCLAIPYREGYRLSVDGQPTELEKINKMYMGAWIEAGEHRIRLEYTTPGLGAGAAVSVVGILLTALLCVGKKWGRNRRSRSD